MTILAEVLLPTGAFGIERLFEEFPDARVEFEQIVPLASTGPKILRVDQVDGSDLERVFQQSDCLYVLDVLTDVRDQRLLVVRLSADHSPVLQALAETDVHVLNVVGRSNSWEFRARFADHDELIDFNQQLTSEGIPVTLQRLYNSDPELPPPISDKQKEAVRLAVHQGYFEIPRQCTIEELAHSVGISDSAFSQRLRRGIANCVRIVLEEQV